MLTGEGKRENGLRKETDLKLFLVILFYFSTETLPSFSNNSQVLKKLLSNLYYKSYIHDTYIELLLNIPDTCIKNVNTCRNLTSRMRCAIVSAQLSVSCSCCIHDRNCSKQFLLIEYTCMRKSGTGKVQGRGNAGK